MGLDFSAIKDGHGSAVYILCSKSSRETLVLERLKDDIAKRANNQVILLEAGSQNGEKVRDFYDIPHESLPAVIIVRDDDTVVHMWSKDALPTSEQVAYQLSL